MEIEGTNINKYFTYQKTRFLGDPYVMGWTSRNLPSSKFCFITDLDLIIRLIIGNVEHMMFLEIKRRMAKPPPHQQITFDIIHKLINEGLRAKKNKVKCKKGIVHNIKYHGFHLLQFQNTSFEDGLVFWNGDLVTEEQLIKILSFK